MTLNNDDLTEVAELLTTLGHVQKQRLDAHELVIQIQDMQIQELQERLADLERQL